MKQIQIMIPDRALKDVDDSQRSTSRGNDSLQGWRKRNYQEVAVGRGTMKYRPEYIPRTKVEVVVKDDQIDLLIKNILDELRANETSGKIFVLEVPIIFDISTGKKGESAI